MIHVAGIILVRKGDGSVLLQHRDNSPGVFYPNYWCYPGGAARNLELFEGAAKRELLEETGYKVREIFPLIEEKYERYDGTVMKRHVYWSVYDEQQKITCREGQEIAFIMPTDFTGKKFIPGQERLFKMAINLALKK